MVETKRITTPVKFYGANYITRRCGFEGSVQNQSALYDNASESLASFYNADVSQPVRWRVAFKDKYGQITSRVMEIKVENGNYEQYKTLANGIKISII